MSDERRSRREDSVPVFGEVEERELRVLPAMAPAGGLGAALSSLKHGASQLGLGTLGALRALNQEDGFDCPGCAWPDPVDRSAAEFCENGVKHVAHEGTHRRAGPEFFAEHTVADLRRHSDHWLEQQGRLTHPMHLREGSDHYEQISWEDAFRIAGESVQRLADPDQAIFYTSGRTSNEAAFLYQLLARRLGTNNLPDCSNMCHESSGTGLNETIGVGKGTVGLEDFEHADLILVMGQNPGTNHPRMLTTLQEAVRRGCRIVSINPLKEAGLVRFSHPKEPLALLGRSTPIADVFIQVRIGGDIAFLKGVMKEVLAAEEAAPGSVLDAAFIAEKTEGFEEWRSALRETAWEEIEEQCGIERARIHEVAELYLASERVIACWAMGLTQHAHGVANVQEIVNLLLLRGQIGKPGAGVCPVRGHSNVQGDRTMGIWERPPEAFLDRLSAEFGFEAPRKHGFDTLDAIEAMSGGSARVFIGLGGNFAVAAPDSEVTCRALSRCDLTVQVSTVLNRSHLVCGKEALILPCLGRSERDVQGAGDQFVTVENSMSVVHRSEGRRKPASAELRSEPAIVAGLARSILGAEDSVPWESFVQDYDGIRDRIERVIPGFERYNERVREAGGFVLTSGARERRFETESGRAHFSVHPLPELRLPPGRLRMMTIRSHDQFNTTVYSHDDRYRGIYGNRRVVLMNAEELEERGLATGDRVTLRSYFADDERTLHGFLAVAYDIPRGCAATYYPESNPLVPLGHFAKGSRTPAYKSVEVSVTPESA